MPKRRIRSPKTVNPFYVSPPWRHIRRVALHRDGYRCTICGKDVSGPGEARVDHIQAIETHPHLALVLSNLRTLCTYHDSQAHRERRHGGPRQATFVIKGSNVDGMPIDPAHPWLNGR